jgi:hypothetical protein
MGKYRKKTEVIKFTTEVLENINRRLEDRKRFIIEGQEVPESTLRKRLRMEPTNFIRPLES